MHTTEYKSCRIHHNGDYSDEIYITNKDQTSKPVGSPAVIRSSTDLMFTYAECGRISRVSAKKKITIPGIAETGYDEKITVLFEDVKAYVDNVLMDRILTKVEKWDSKIRHDQIIAVAQILKIPTDKWSPQ
jgi:hypothetical protein